MEYREYAPWEHYPKTLTPKEIMDPMVVLEEFFGLTSVAGHGKELKKWRNYVVNEGCYDDKRHGAGDLLFIYDLNVKLIEAVSLLLYRYNARPFPYKPLSIKELNAEIEEREGFVKKISDKELPDPFKVIKKIFKDLGPQHYRDCLHEWLRAALYKQLDVEGLNAYDVVIVYDNMKKLYAAAWPIYLSSKPDTMTGDVLNPEVTLPVGGIAVEASIREIHSSPTPAEKLGLEELNKLILVDFPFVRIIAYLGSHPSPFTYFLLILIDDEEKTPEAQLSNKIEDHCRNLVRVHAIVHKVCSAKEGINAGKRFWCSVMTKSTIVFRSEIVQLPVAGAVDKKMVLEKMEFNWNRYGAQGKAFLEGAEFYLAKENFRLAAFLLHQAAESIFKAIIQVATGYRVQMHNLSRLLRLSLLVSDGPKDVFELDTVEGGQLFTLLQNAYSRSRYSDTFDPDEDSIKLLFEKIILLYKTAEYICGRLIEKE